MAFAEEMTQNEIDSEMNGVGSSWILNFAFKTMNCVLKMMMFVLKMMKCVSKMMNFARRSRRPIGPSGSAGIFFNTKMKILQ